MVTVRPVAPQDRPAWDALYQGYARFYQVEQTAQMRDRVWEWLMDANHEVNGFVAVDQAGHLVGLAHYRPFSSPLSAAVKCFLDDLYVDPAARGAEAAGALINAARARATQEGWTTVRWITADDNYRARGLYDRMAQRTLWITYDLDP